MRILAKLRGLDTVENIPQGFLHDLAALLLGMCEIFPAGDWSIDGEIIKGAGSQKYPPLSIGTKACGDDARFGHRAPRRIEPLRRCALAQVLVQQRFVDEFLFPKRTFDLIEV